MERGSRAESEMVPGAPPLQSAHEPDWGELLHWEEAFLIR
jgi:hypothetical protein